MMKKILLLLLLVSTAAGTSAQWKWGIVKQNFNISTEYDDDEESFGNYSKDDFIIYAENSDETVTIYESVDSYSINNELGTYPNSIISNNVEFTGYYFGEVRCSLGNDYVNVRKGAGTDEPVIGKLRGGCGIIFEKTESNWLKVFLFKTKDGEVAINDDGFFEFSNYNSSLSYFIRVLDECEEEKKEWEITFIGYINNNEVETPFFITLEESLNYHNYSRQIKNEEKQKEIEGTEPDSLPSKPVLTKVLAKKEVRHANDIVELTPEFIKAIQKYEELGSFSEGLAAVRKKGEWKWGYINTKGEMVIPDTIEANWVGRFSEGIAFACDANSYYLIDRKGKIVLEIDRYGGASYEDCAGWGTFSNDMPYYINGKLYVTKMEGSIEDTEQGGMKLKVDVIDKCGNMTIVYLNEKEIPSENAASTLYTIFEETGKEEYEYWYGVKDSKGNIVIPAQYGYISDFFSNGVFLVGLIEKDAPWPSHWGYVDLKGNDTFSEDIKKRWGRH